MEKILDSVSHFEKSLTDLDAELIEFRYQPTSFGSWYIILRKNGKLLRIVYEGIEDQCFLQEFKSQDDWYDCGAVTNAADWVAEILSRLRLLKK